jgi:hypothetical protein
LRKTFQQFILLKKMAIAAHFHYNVELRWCEVDLRKDLVRIWSCRVWTVLRSSFSSWTKNTRTCCVTRGWSSIFCRACIRHHVTGESALEWHSAREKKRLAWHTSHSMSPSSVVEGSRRFFPSLRWFDSDVLLVNFFQCWTPKSRKLDRNWISSSIPGFSIGKTRFKTFTVERLSWAILHSNCCKEKTVGSLLILSSLKQDSPIGSQSTGAKQTLSETL